MERKFMIEMAVTFNDEDWDEAGYDPLGPNLHQQCLQVAEWLRNSQYLGGTEVATTVRSVNLGETPRVANEARTGFHIATLARDGDANGRDELVIENQHGHEVARADIVLPDSVFALLKEFVASQLGIDSATGDLS